MKDAPNSITNAEDTTSPQDFNIFVKSVRFTFIILSNRTLVLCLSIIVISSSYLVDCYNTKPLYLEKFAAVVTILGIILTIKHNFLKNLSSIQTHINSAIGVGRLGSAHPITDPTIINNSKK